MRIEPNLDPHGDPQADEVFVLLILITMAIMIGFVIYKLAL